MSATNYDLVLKMTQLKRVCC